MTWSDVIGPEKQKLYFKAIYERINDDLTKGKKVFPPPPLVFNAFSHTPLEKVKTVILGQDPYHGPGQAHGLAFSVQKGVGVPPSLKNIYKELRDDVGFIVPEHGDLTAWADQGVLLLNSVLTVVQSQPQSHAGIGWEEFTDLVIQAISNNLTGVVFMLWGSYAKKKGAVVDRSKHLVLEAPHPSPLSAHRGFFGSKHFSKANSYLKESRKGEITWQL